MIYPFNEGSASLLTEEEYIPKRWATLLDFNEGSASLLTEDITPKPHRFRNSILQ